MACAVRLELGLRYPLPRCEAPQVGGVTPCQGMRIASRCNGRVKSISSTTSRYQTVTHVHVRSVLRKVPYLLKRLFLDESRRIVLLSPHRRLETS